MHDRDSFDERDPFDDGEVEDQPMTTGDVVHNPSVQAGLVLLLMLLALLVLWLTWTLISSA